MKFVTKLTLMFSLIGMAFIILVSYSNYVSNMRILEMQIRHNLEERASHAIDKIDRMLYEKYIDIRRLSTDPVVSSRNSTLAHVNERLMEYAGNDQKYSSISFYDLNRVRLLDTSGENIGIQDPVNDYWSKITSGSDFAMDTAMSVTLQQVAFRFAHVVKDKTATPFAVVTSRVLVEHLYNIARQATSTGVTDTEFEVELIDKNGLILYSNYHKDKMLHEKSSHWEVIRQMVSEGKSVSSMKHSHSDKDIEELLAFAQEAGYLNFQGNDWTLIIYAPARLVYTSAVSLRNISIVVSLLIGAFATLIIYLLSRNVSVPIKRLALAAAEVGKGNLDITVNVTSGDEMGQLSGLFNNMVADLRQYQDKLVSYSTELEHKVSQRTATLINLNRRLNILSRCNHALAHAASEAVLTHDICRIVVEDGGYSLAWIGMLHDSRDVLVVAQAGYEKDYIESLKLTAIEDDTLHSRAILMGKPVISNDIAADPDTHYLRTEASRYAYASTISLPLLHQDSVIGVLTICAANTDAFDAQEVGLLVELTEDLSFGIDSLRLHDEHKRMQAELLTAKDDLQDRVAQRTAQLELANKGLSERAAVLQQRDSENKHLSKMSELLLACATVEEACAIIVQTASELFVSDSGALYAFSSSHNILESRAAWGDMSPESDMFKPDECWALRRGRPHTIMYAQSVMRCQHVGSSQNAYICVPMMAQGEILGLLHLQVAPVLSTQNDSQALKAKEQLATVIAENSAMAIANLKLRQTLQHLSTRDPLTGLYNRRYMEDAFELERSRAIRRGTTVGVIMVDIDHFKRFNDTFGHEAGDAVLRELGIFLKKNIRSGDIACRYGGEEFALIMPDASLDVALQRADILREGIKHINVVFERQSLGAITLSLGVAVLPEHGVETQTIFQAADSALYSAKHQGRDRVCIAV
ncbi:MAG: diguanylate cyclase [Nitrospirae bacterium]|uniref:diguanylate cyclase n=1 Tax=Candidatus Magnetobacterium casense TaxID=1455061 RepID=UPI000698E39F|nr:diguanylate cyclase [Candidatus Magnetobacterium casensis]MBF0337634.1 diguanylate cyclase [Nitrospirota bacterium]